MRNKSINHITNILSKCHYIFIENFASFFQVQEELDTCRNSKVAISRRPSCRDDVNGAFKS